MKIKFEKLNGAGNDYVFIDCINQDLSNIDFSDLSVKVSNRNYGIGSDGLIVILKSEITDFKMRMFNADGSEAQMCGNGIRSFAKFVYDNNLTDKKTIEVETLAGIKVLDLFFDENDKVNKVKVNMGEPILKGLDIPTNIDKEELVKEKLEVGGKEFEFTAISMGNPHCIIFVDEIKDELVLEYGPKIQELELFPESVNVEFIKVISKDEMGMRVYERGTGETMACGTGATAVGVAGVLNGLTNRKVLIHLLGGDLEIDWDEKSNNVFMTGPTALNCKGEFIYQKE